MVTEPFRQGRDLARCIFFCSTPLVMAATAGDAKWLVKLLNAGYAALAPTPPAPAQSGDGWLPICTAPKDNTPVLLGFWAKPSDDPAEWRWTVVSGWYEAAPADRCWYEDLTEEPVQPTHWMPSVSPSKREG